jgi:hypothetical protein
MQQATRDDVGAGNGSPVPGLPAPENLERPEPAATRDYLALNATYGALLAGLLIANERRRRGQAAAGRRTLMPVGVRRSRPDVPERISAAELLPLGAATFALSKTVAREKIGTWMREPFVEEDVPGRPPRGRRLRYAVGELVTCTRCVGAWSALALVGLRTASPEASRTLTSVLATAALNDFLQAGFRALCEQVNARAAASGAGQ